LEEVRLVVVREEWSGSYDFRTMESIAGCSMTLRFCKNKGV
jgi:hypothetical protein